MRRRRRVRGHQPTRHAGPCQQWQVKTSGSMTVCTTSSELPASADCSLGCMPEPCTPSASMCLKSCVRLGNSCSGASQAWRRHERGVRSGWHAAATWHAVPVQHVATRYNRSAWGHEAATWALGAVQPERTRASATGFGAPACTSCKCGADQSCTRSESARASACAAAR